MYTHQNITIILALILSLGIASCSSPKKLAESGDYDAAIQRAVNKLAGKDKKKADDVLALELAFDKANKSSIRQIEEMKADGREQLWPSILKIIDQIAYRQQLVDPLIPLTSYDGYQADFKFIRIEAIRPEAVEKTTAYYYNRGSELLVLARKGNKGAAQDAYHSFNDAQYYNPQYKDVMERKEEARYLGITHVAISFENRSNMFLPDRFAQDLLQVSTGELNETWRKYYTNPSPDVPLDFTVIVQLDHIGLKPEFVRQHEYQLEKEVADGYRVKKDRDGNAILDSLGQEIRIPKMITVQADILEVYKSKSAMVEGSLEYYNNRTGSLIDMQRIGTEVIFENTSAIFRGDKRALNDDVLNILDNKALPFPSDGDLILQASDRLRPIICDFIRNFRWSS
ncbi:MAG: hypothetical protein KDC34_12985 [Saprospiraceae bacterium]|nr:hypothetical protein [Saprospiraceae bacterium]